MVLSVSYRLGDAGGMVWKVVASGKLCKDSCGILRIIQRMVARSPKRFMNQFQGIIQRGTCGGSQYLHEEVLQVDAVFQIGKQPVAQVPGSLPSCLFVQEAVIRLAPHVQVDRNFPDPGAERCHRLSEPDLLEDVPVRTSFDVLGACFKPALGMTRPYQGMELVDQGIRAVEHDGTDFQHLGFQMADADLVFGKVDQFHIHDGDSVRMWVFLYCHFAILAQND